MSKVPVTVPTTLEVTHTQKAWAVYTNTDLTEGRGRQVLVHLCDIEATARRLSKGIGVQGGDGDVAPVTMYYTDKGILGPVMLTYPTESDIHSQKAIDAVAEKMREIKEIENLLLNSGIDPKIVTKITTMATNPFYKPKQ